MRHLPDHLRRLESESIEIMREVVAEFKKPVMLYSIGKDSSVMLHLAIKAFYPAPLPFPLLHVDTTWKFREMISFRDETARQLQTKFAGLRERGRHQAGDQSDQVRFRNPHACDEDRGTQASSR